MNRKFRKCKRAVNLYMILLFASAFLLLTLAYFMQERAYAAEVTARLITMAP